MLLDRLKQFRQSPENPSTSLSNPASWLYTASGVSDDVWSGARVSETTALNYSAYMACVRVLAETLATVSLKVYRRGANNSREEARDHPAYGILHSRPNPEITAFQFRELLQAHVVTWGNAYAEVERTKGGRLVALWPITPDRARVERRSGMRVLVVRVGAKDVILTPDKYMHVAGLGFDGMHGYSPVKMARQAIGLGMGTEEYGARWFGSGGKPPMVVTHPSSLTEDAAGRVRSKLTEQHSSLSKSQRLMVLDEGMDVKVIGIPNDDAQFLETRKFQVEEMARIHRLPLHKIQHLENATFSNIEHQAIEFVQDAAMPWAVRWEQVYNYSLFSEMERGTYYVEHSLDTLLRGDAKSRSEALAVQRQWGIINADEWRSLENMNPLPEGQGETYLVPMNMVPADEADEAGSEDTPPEPEPEDETDEPDEERAARSDREMRSQRSAAARHRQALSYRQLFERAASHFVNREAGTALRILRRAFEGDNPVETFLREIAKFYDGAFPEAIRRELLPVVLSLAEVIRGEVVEEVGTGPGQDKSVDAMSTAYVDGYVARHVNKSRGKIQDTINEVEPEALLDELTGLFERWQDARAANIGNNEAIRASGALAKAAYFAVGVIVLRWATMGDTCPLCSMMEGRTVGIQEFFLTEGDTVDPQTEGVRPLRASHSISHPPLHGGCDCMIIAGS